MYEGKFLTLGNGAVMYYENGKPPVSAKTKLPGAVVGIAYGSGKFVAVSGNAAAYSSDGETWNPCTEFNFSGICCIAHVGSKFVVVSGGGIVASSSDGKQWSKENIPLGANISCIAGEIDDTGNEITEVLTDGQLG